MNIKRTVVSQLTDNILEVSLYSKIYLLGNNPVTFEKFPPLAAPQSNLCVNVSYSQSCNLISKGAANNEMSP